MNYLGGKRAGYRPLVLCTTVLVNGVLALTQVGKFLLS